ncbi:hypothetical protein [Flaviaesturariibacter amylovorans]|uniref:TlpA family protein disulfide reductase n=1 Tax=Flaviaesturariibacter amylovorans TaxID=1084520 RepID=A0ABP8HPG3_9BACT
MTLTSPLLRPLLCLLLLAPLCAGAQFKPFTLTVRTDHYEGDWLRTIRKFGLPWPQYRDVGGSEAARLNIVSFPSNFLLDAQGNILKKDLSPTELAVFLNAQEPD